jgi:hypothetical protein
MSHEAMPSIEIPDRAGGWELEAGVAPLEPGKDLPWSPGGVLLAGRKEKLRYFLGDGMRTAQWSAALVL